MAATLADVTEKLSNQNEILVDVNKNMSSVSTNLSAFLDSLKANSGDKLEEEIENREKVRQRDKESRVQVKSGLFDNFGLPEGFTLGAGIAFVTGLAGGILKRMVPAAIALAFADEIANFIESTTGQKALGDAVFRGLKLGSLGLLISKRLGVIGFVGGSLLTPKVQEEIGKLEDSFNIFKERMEMFFNTTLPDLSGLIGYVGNIPVASLQFLNAALAGDFDSEEFKNNWDEFGAAIGLLALILAPKSTLLTALAGVTAVITRSDKILKGLVFGGAAATSAAVLAQIEKANTNQIKNLSRAELDKLTKQGITRNLEGKLFDTRTGTVLSPEQARGALTDIGVKNPINSRLASKSPTFQKLLSAGRRVPYLGAAISAGSLAATLMGGGSSEEKITDFGRFFGGTTGAVTLGALGSLAGGPLVGIPAGLLGFGAGEAAGEWLAQKILEEAGMIKKSSANVPTPPSAEELPTSAFSVMGGRDMALSMRSDANAQRLTAPPPRSGGLEGYALADMIGEFMAKGSGPVIVMDNSNRSINSSGVTNQAMITPPAAVYDKYDYMNASRV